VADFTWGDLKAQIAFRLNRTDLPPIFIQTMAVERIDFWGPQVLFPAEVTNDDIVTQAGVQFYDLPRGTQKVRYVRVLFNGVWIPVGEAEDYSDILYADPLQPPFVSLPVSLYKILGNQIRLFPTPDAAYPVELTMDQTIVEPQGVTEDADRDTTNFWVTDGRMLLINSTCSEICREYLDIELGANSPRIQVFDQNTQMALDQLMGRSHNLTSPSIMKQYI
jgi:hypothetical protein